MKRKLALGSLMALVLALGVTGIVAAGGEDVINLHLPKCIPVGETVNALAEVHSGLSGGQVIWKVVGGVGTVEITFPNPNDHATCSIRGGKPGSIQIQVEYVRLDAEDNRVVLASSPVVSSTVDEVEIYPSSITATEGEAADVTLSIIPPPDPEVMGFQINETEIQLVDTSSQTIIFSQIIPVESFSQDPFDPNRYIFETTITPPTGTAGNPNLILTFSAETQIDDPVTGAPILLDNYTEVPVTVLPASGPTPEVTVTAPASPFEVETGEATYVDVDITTADPAATTANVEIGIVGQSPDSVEPLDLSSFTQSGDTISGRYDFNAPASSGIYFVRIVANTPGGVAEAEVEMTVQEPMQTPEMVITTSTPLEVTEGGSVAIDFEITPVEALPLIVAMDWTVKNPAGTMLFSAPFLKEELSTVAGKLVGQVVFTMPEGLVTQVTDLDFELICAVQGYDDLSATLVIRTSPVPQTPVELTIYVEPESPVFESEEVSFGFLISPKTVEPNIDAISFEVRDAETGAQLLVGNVDLATLVINDHILGSLAFPVALGWHEASSGTGDVEVEIKVFISGQEEASDIVVFTVLEAPILTVTTAGPLQLIEEETAEVTFELAPDQVNVTDLRWVLRTIDGIYALAAGVLDPADLTPSGGVLQGGFSFQAPLDSAPFSENPGLEIVVIATVDGFSGGIDGSVLVEIEEQGPPQPFEVQILNPEPMELGEYQYYPFYLKILGISSPSDVEEIYLTLESGTVILAEHTANPADLVPWEDGYAVSFYVFVPKGTAGFSVEATAMARTASWESIDTAQGIIDPFPEGEVADYVLLSEDFFSMPLNSTHGPVRVQALDIQGNPMAGEEISFSINDPRVANCSPSISTTGADGVGDTDIKSNWWVCHYIIIFGRPVFPPTPGPVPPPGPKPGPADTPPHKNPAKTGENMPAADLASFIFKILSKISSLFDFVDWHATGSQVPGLKSDLNSLYETCLAGDAEGAETRFGGIVSEAREMVSSGAMSLDDAKQLLHLTVNTEGMAGVINADMIPEDMEVYELPFCIPVCCPDWKFEGKTQGGSDFLKVTHDLKPNGSVHPKLVLCVGDVLLLTAPNSNSSNFSGECHAASDRDRDKEAAGDIPVTIWEDIDKKNGKLHFFKKMYTVEWKGANELVHGMLGLYEAPCPEKNGKKEDKNKNFSNPKAPGGVTVNARILPNQGFEKRVNIDFVVIGVDKKITWSKDEFKGTGENNGLKIDELVVFKAEIKTDDGHKYEYEDYIDWALDGKIVGKGKELKIRIHQPGTHSLQAWVGLSRSDFKQFYVRNPSTPFDRVDLKELERKVMEKRLEKRKKLIEGMKAYVDKQGESWKEYRWNKFHKELSYGRHSSESCKVWFSFDNTTLDEKGEEFTGDIRGWLHSARWFDPRWDGGDGFAPLITIPAHGSVHMNLLSIDLDMMKRIDCVHGGSNLPKNDHYGQFGKLYEQRFGDTRDLEWLPPVGPGFLDVGDTGVEFKGNTSTGGGSSVKCKIKNPDGSRPFDATIEKNISIDLFSAKISVVNENGKLVSAGEIQENTDDDDSDGCTDLDQHTNVDYEDDLLEVNLQLLNGVPADGTIRITWERKYLSLWSEQNKGPNNRYPEMVVPGETDDWACMYIHVSELDGTSNSFITLWVEGKRITEKMVYTIVGADYFTPSGKFHLGNSITVTVKERKRVADLEIYWPGNAGVIHEHLEENPGGITGPGIRTRVVIKKPDIDDSSAVALLEVAKGGDKIKVYSGQEGYNDVPLPYEISANDIPSEGEELWVEAVNDQGDFGLKLSILVDELIPLASQQSDIVLLQAGGKVVIGTDLALFLIHVPVIQDEVALLMNEGVENSEWKDANFRPDCRTGVTVKAKLNLGNLLYNNVECNTESKGLFKELPSIEYNKESKKWRTIFEVKKDYIGKANIKCNITTKEPVYSFDVGSATIWVDTLSSLKVSPKGGGKTHAERENWFKDETPGTTNVDFLVELYRGPKSILKGGSEPVLVHTGGTVMLDIKSECFFKLKDKGISFSSIKWALLNRADGMVKMQGDVEDIRNGGRAYISGIPSGDFYVIAGPPGIDGVPLESRGAIKIEVSTIDVTIFVNDESTTNDDVIVRKPSSTTKKGSINGTTESIVSPKVVGINEQGPIDNHGMLTVRIGKQAGRNSVKILFIITEGTGGKIEIRDIHGNRLLDDEYNARIGQDNRFRVLGIKPSQAFDDIRIGVHFLERGVEAAHVNTTVIWTEPHSFKGSSSAHQNKGFSNFNSETLSWAYFGTPLEGLHRDVLGVQDYDWPTKTGTIGSVCQCEIAFEVFPRMTVNPKGIKWDMKRLMRERVWSNLMGLFKPKIVNKWTDDDTMDLGEDLLAEKNNSLIFALDAPSLIGMEYAKGAFITDKFSMREYVEVKIGKYWFVCSEYQEWHSILHTRFVSDEKGWVRYGVNEVLPGSIPGKPSSWKED
jgi:hypothetical protein